MQTAMVKAWPRWDRVCAGGDPDAYVRRTLFTTYASWWRRRWRAEVPTEVLPDGQPAPDAYADADLRQALAQLLPARQRAILVLRYYEDLTETQVAEALGVSVGTVNSQASKALARLRSATDLLVRMEDGR